MKAPHYNLMSAALRLRLQTRRYICFNNFVIFSPSEDGGASKQAMTARELKFPTRRSGAPLAREPAKKRYTPPNWTQMAVFVQGRRRPRRGSVARLMIARERGVGRGEWGGGRGEWLPVLRSRRPGAGGWQAVWSTKPPDTPAPLDTESGDTRGLIVGLSYALSGSDETLLLCQTFVMHGTRNYTGHGQ